MTDSDLIYGLFATFDYPCFSISQLKCLTAPFEVSETSLRSILSRMKKQNVLEISRKGRTAFYTPTAGCRRFGANTARAFHEPEHVEWDGKIVSAAFSLSDSSSRYQLQKKLKEYRFAPLFPGFWVRPFSDEYDYNFVFNDFIKSGNCCLTIGLMTPEMTPGTAAELWNLKELWAIMEKQVASLEITYSSLESLSAEEVFRKKMEEGDAAVRILAEDPLLPPVLQGNTRPGAELRQVFMKFDKKATELSRPFWSACLKS